MEQGSETLQFAEEEFGCADLGDLRRTKRLVRIAAGVAEDLGRCISSSCGKSGAQAVSHLFDHEEVTVDSVLEPHIAQTGTRCAGHEWVLAVQDTTFLDFGGRRGIDGLGPIGTNKKSRGLIVHSVLATTLDKTPLGLLGMQIWARSVDKPKPDKKRLLAEKESYKWIRGLEQAEAGISEDQNLLIIGDRESDLYGLFVHPRRDNTELLVRVTYFNRTLKDEEHRYLSEALEASRVVGTHKIEVPRQGSRRKRTATLEVKIASVTLKPPAARPPDVANRPVKVYLVQVRETAPPDGVEGLEWTLLTTVPVENLEQAKWIVRAYTARWVIEEFHHVLKSGGCRVEDMQFETVERMKPAIALCAVVAWRTLNLTKYAREAPNSPAAAVASPQEIAVVEVWLHKQGEKDARIRTVSEFVRGVGMLGGFLGRKSDGQPGPKTVGRGLVRLEYLLEGVAMANQLEM